MADREMLRNETNPDSMTVSNYSRSYAAKVLEILIKANAGRNEPTKAERKTQIAIFLEVLYGHVPENRLNDCYVYLMRTRTSTYPLAPNEICIAWAAIKESEMNRPINQGRLAHGFCE